MSASEILRTAHREAIAAAAAWPGHAVLLVGPEDVGRDELAEAMAVAWAGLEPPYPDLWRRAAPIPIDDVRALGRLVAEHPLAATRRAVVVAVSERLSPLVQNAFLRLVEEPPGPAAFLFTAENPYRLLPTLRSRFTPIPLRPLARDRFVAAMVQAAGWSAAQAEALYESSGGWPARALRRAAEAGTPSLPAVSGPFGFLAVARAEEAEPARLLGQVEATLRARLSTAGADFRSVRLGLLRVDEARRRLDRHQQPALVLENLLLDLEALGLIPAAGGPPPPSRDGAGGRGGSGPRPAPA